MPKTDDFAKQLAGYKQAIDADIAHYSSYVRRATKSEYGGHPAAVTEEYLDLLNRGGKRIRGALVMCAYEMLGGTDQQMIVRAATALELLHAGILIFDDIQDQDSERRGSRTAHVALADYHRKLQLHGSPDHTGLSLAINAALTGLSATNVLLAGLSVDPQLRLNAIGIVNQTLITTVHGQTYDFINSHLDNPPAEEVDRTREWKSAHYTFLNPLCVGMVLAGAPCEDTDAIRDYALHTGLAFQLADDILDGDIPKSETAKARRQAEDQVKQAVAALENAKRPWAKSQVDFLRGLAAFVIARDS